MTTPKNICSSGNREACLVQAFFVCTDYHNGVPQRDDAREQQENSKRTAVTIAWLTGIIGHDNLNSAVACLGLVSFFS